VRRGLLAAALAAALPLRPARAQAGPPALVFAAASLKEALDAAFAARSAGGGGRPAVSYAGSPALARQIEQGAPADLFVSADVAWMDHLEARGLLAPGSRAPLLTNALVLVAPAAAARAAGPVPRLAPGVDLAPALGDGRLAVADVATVPAGRYAKAALESLGAWRTVAGRLAATENVRAALALVARGEAPLGIVYATDARAEPRVRIVGAFPASAHPPIVYPIARLVRSRSPDAGPLLDWLRSAQAGAVFAAHGFGVPAR
jgi:molybdate transport system substrate-binding protein